MTVILGYSAYIKLRIHLSHVLLDNIPLTITLNSTMQSLIL